ncbi:hypothetical protein ACFRCX_30415 [Streptomyces sp. NPDC056652]|uniref:hypothetical protein n=1 Tax=Streptomyces sp. NPDC056652 TaxID=3345893 RepID=UPI0036C194D9
MAELTYKQLLKAVTDLQKDVTRSSEAIRVKAQQMDEEARDTARIAEMIGGMGVDSDTISETRDLSRLMNGVSEAAIAYASAGDNTAKAAKAAYDQAHATHGGIQEAFARAAVDMTSLDRDWLRQD